jgi:hypothetical protein
MKAWGTAVRSGDVHLDYRLREAKKLGPRWHRVCGAGNGRCWKCRHGMVLP